jgi:hypothetical protein
MTWVRLDDDTPDHPKYLSFGDLAPLALALQVRALCYANHYLTDGHVPAGALPQLLRGFAPCQPDTGEVIDWPALMVDAGIWETNGGAGYVIHDYATYQRSKAQVEADREVRRAAARAGGQARAAHAQRSGGRFQSSTSGTSDTPAGNAGAHAGGQANPDKHLAAARRTSRPASPAIHQPRPGPVPVPERQDLPPTSARTRPAHIREVLNGQRLRLQVNSPEPDSPAPAPGDQPGPDVPW